MEYVNNHDILPGLYWNISKTSWIYQRRECNPSASFFMMMVIHLIHNPICAKNFVNPIVTFLNDNGIEAELWFEPWEKTKMFTLSVDCPKSFAWFDLSFNPFIFLARLVRLSKRFIRLRPTAIHAYQAHVAFIPL